MFVSWRLTLLFTARAHPCCCSKVQDGSCFFVWVYVDEFSVAFSDPAYFEACLAPFRGYSDMDQFPDFKLFKDITYLLQHQTHCFQDVP